MHERLAELARFEDVHLALGKRMFFADGGALYPLDILAGAALNRSVNLLRGFV
jgi:hypothetical protein